MFGFPVEASFLVLVLAMGTIVIVFGVRLWLLERKLRWFLKGKKGDDLEDVLIETRRTLEAFGEQFEKERQLVADIEQRLQGAVQHVGVVRFNPFGDAGGDQSFALAMLDAERTGAVVSSLYARDGVRVYAKPVNRGTSTYPLSEEEKTAIEKAVNGAL